MTEGFKKIGDYSLMRLVGQGASSKVFEGRKEGSPQPLAIKMISIRALPVERRENIAKEVAIIKNMNHPNIVKLYDTVETKNNYYLIFEYCERGDLEAYLRDHYGVLMPEASLQKVFFCIADAVAFIHSRGIVHRDLKLANILLKKDSTIKLADFGFAKESSHDMLMKSYIGTPITMAPEILQRQPYDQKCDIWSLGVILFQLCFGTLPFSISDGYLAFIEKVAHEPLCIPNRQKCNPALVALLQKCLQKSGQRRYDIEEVMKNSWVQMGKVSNFKAVKDIYRLKIDEKSSFPKQQFNKQQLSLAQTISQFLNEQVANIIERHMSEREGILQLSGSNKSLVGLLHYYDRLFLYNLSKTCLCFGEQYLPIKDILRGAKIPPALSSKSQPLKAGVVLIEYLKSVSLEEETTNKIKMRYETVMKFLAMMRSFDFKISVLESSAKNPMLNLKRVVKALKESINSASERPLQPIHQSECFTLIFQCKEKNPKLRQIRQSLTVNCIQRIGQLSQNFNF